MYTLCVSGAVNKQRFVWKFLCAIYKFIHSFIHTLPDSLYKTELPIHIPLTPMHPNIGVHA